jgi:hypothetical protein
VPWRQLFAVLGLAAALVIPFGFTFMQFWNATGDDLSFTSDERAGVEYLRPLTKLVSVLSDAESAAVRGQQPSIASLEAAAAAVGNVDRKVGDRLGTQERWSSLSQRLTQAAGRKVTGRDGFTTYSENIDLALALLAKVGDSSNLILDPRLDSYYLMDTAMLRLPPLLVDSGRMVDLSRLAGSGTDETAVDQVFAARDRVANTVAAVDLGLKKSFDSTSSSTLGPSLLGQVDRLRSVSIELAPSTSLIDLQVSVAPADVDKLAASRDRLRDAAIQLDDATLTELDSLLGGRQDGINQQRTGVIVAILLAALVAAWVLWTRLPERGQAEDEDEWAEPPRHRRTDASTEPDDREAPAVSDLIDARALLASGELARVGRAVQPSRRERLRDDAE